MLAPMMDVKYGLQKSPAQIPAAWVLRYLESGRTDTFPCKKGAASITLDFSGALPAIWGSLTWRVAMLLPPLRFERQHQLQRG